MKSPLSVLIFFVSIFFLSSCGNGKLTKEEAKKQIDAQANKNRKPQTFAIPVLYWTEHGDENNIRALNEIKNAGYVDYTPYNEANYPGQRLEHYLKVRLLDKARPFFVGNTLYDGTHDYFEFNAGEYAEEVMSIAEPAPDKNGNIVCNVECHCTFDLNDLYKTFSKIKNNYCYVAPYDGTETEKFIKTQDGWKLKKD